MNNDEYIKDLQRTRNLKPKTVKVYKDSLKRYSAYHNLTLEELLTEAEEDEEKLRMRKRRIKKRILDFQEHLQKKGYTPYTIRAWTNPVKTFYKTYHIEVPPIQNIRNTRTETIQDIPNVEHIRLAAQTDRLKQKALILFMASSGTGSYETLQLRVNDFISATTEYHDHEDIRDVLSSLGKEENIIPTWQFRREKTNYQYYTFSSPESTAAIIQYLQSRPELRNKESLFDLSSSGLMKLFQRINKRYGWGKTGSYNFFHAHSLRKFFATTLTRTRIDHLLIEWMLGHSINTTTAAYYKSDPHHLKDEYRKVVNELSIKDVKIVDITPKQIKKLVNEADLNVERIRVLEERDRMREEQLKRLFEELEK